MSGINSADNSDLELENSDETGTAEPFSVEKNQIAKPTKNQLLIAELEKETDSAKKYIDKSLSKNTLKAYKSQWEQFVAWCELRKLDYLPAKPEVVAVFISFMADNNKKFATIAHMLSSIAKAHKRSKLDSPVLSEVVRETFSGILSEIGSIQDGATPLELEDLRMITHSLDNSEMGIRDRALLLTGWFGAFRRSELVSVLKRDVVFSDEGMKIKLRKSKTDQEGKGFVKPIHRQKDLELDPVSALTDWLLIAPDSKFLFCHVEGFRGPAKIGGKLSDRMVCRLLQKWTKRFSIPGNFSGHSLRAGFVTAAAKAGKSNRSIMKITGHVSSKMVDRYVRIADEFMDNATDDLVKKNISIDIADGKEGDKK